MKKSFLTIVILLSIFVTIYSISKKTPAPTQPAPSPTVSPSENISNYSNQNFGIAFSYRTGVDGYVLEEKDQTITLTPSLDYERLQRNPPVGGEGSPVISISKFNIKQTDTPLSWAKNNTSFSSYNLKTSEASEIFVSQTKAIRYSADGLYPSQNVIFATSDTLYMITGQYMDESSRIKTDFDLLINSIKLLPKISTKINIEEVCQNALSYMTFPSGQEADTFITNCKSGKHPEVIEKFINDQNLNGATL